MRVLPGGEGKVGDFPSREVPGFARIEGRLLGLVYTRNIMGNLELRYWISHFRPRLVKNVERVRNRLQPFPATNPPDRLRAGIPCAAFIIGWSLLGLQLDLTTSVRLPYYGKLIRQATSLDDNLGGRSTSHIKVHHFFSLPDTFVHYGPYSAPVSSLEGTHIVCTKRSRHDRYAVLSSHTLSRGSIHVRC